MMQNSQVTPKAMGKIGDYLSHLKPVNTLAAVIIFLLPTQLGLHFWPLSSLIYGIRIDYLSPTLYFLDLLIIVYLIFKKREQNNWKLPPKIILAFVPLLLTSLLYSQNYFSTLSWSLHFLLYCLFAISVDLRIVKKVLLSAVVFQIVVATTQVYLGHSLGGLMYYFGERIVAVGSPGIATSTFMDVVVLRGYGTFGHPNVLAGWLLVSLLILFNLKITSKLKYFYGLLFGLGILLTRSAAAELAMLGVIVPFYLINKLKVRIIYLVIFLFSLMYLSVAQPPWYKEPSFIQRIKLEAVSLNIIASYPILGTGANASLSTYQKVAPTFRLLQPDHNSLTLFISWFGFTGVLSILYILRKKLKIILYAISPLLPLFIFDHYFLTSPQGLLILILYIQVLLSKLDKSS